MSGKLDPLVPDLLFVLGFLLPGSLFLLIGLWSWRKEWLAVHEWVLFGPVYIYQALLVYSVWSYDDVLNAATSGGDGGHPIFPYPIVNIITWASILPVLASAVYCIRMGQVLILRARHDIVLRAIERIFDNLRWAHTREEDVFHVPSFKMRVRVNWSETGGVVGISRRCRDGDAREVFDESIMRTFKGRPSETYHPRLVVLGVALMAIGIGLGVLLAMG